MLVVGWLFVVVGGCLWLVDVGCWLVVGGCLWLLMVVASWLLGGCLVACWLLVGCVLVACSVIRLVGHKMFLHPVQVDLVDPFAISI